MSKNRLVLFFIFMAAFALVYQLGSMLPVSHDEATAFMREFEAIVLDIDGFGIFAHNTSIALPMFVPGFGMVWGLFSAWSTGFAFAAITAVRPEIGSIPPLSILFLSPFGIMELVAYSTAISRSFILIRGILQKTGVVRLIKLTLIEIGIVIGLLLAGGHIEFYMIELVQQDPMFLEPSLLPLPLVVDV